jgi:hypothetical protein
MKVDDTGADKRMVNQATMGTVWQLARAQGTVTGARALIEHRSMNTWSPESRRKAYYLMAIFRLRDLFGAARKAVEFSGQGQPFGCRGFRSKIMNQLKLLDIQEAK